MEPCEETKLVSIKLYGNLPVGGQYTHEKVTIDGAEAFHIKARRCMKYQTEIVNGFESVHSIPSGGLVIACVMYSALYLTVAPYKEFRVRPGWTLDRFRTTVHRAYQWGLTELARLGNPPVE